MKKKIKYFKGFTLVEMLLVMGISIILSVVGYNGFLSIRETFIARENVELIIQDIESTKLKAMNMEGGKDATWIYGFGIDFSQADELTESGDYQFFKWCSPVVDYGVDFPTYGNVTNNILPNLSSSPDFDTVIHNYPLCNDNADYYNGTLVSCYFPSNECQENRVGLIKTNEISTLLDREKDQMQLLLYENGATQVYPNYLFFESLTGRAIIYDRDGKPQSYEQVDSEVIFNREEIIPLDIVLYRKRSDKFDLITVYPNSGEVINHVYDESESDGCPSDFNIMEYFKIGSNCYARYGIDEEINSLRN